MGIDIHFLVQIQEPEGWKNVWDLISGEEYIRGKYNWTEEELAKLNPERRQQVLAWLEACRNTNYAQEFYDTREYDTFKILQGHDEVRDHTGWLAVTNMIPSDRGFPEGFKALDCDGLPYEGGECLVRPDLPEGYKLDRGSWGDDLFWLGDWGHSWCTLQELMDTWELNPQIHEVTNIGNIIEKLKPLADSRGLGYQQVRCVYGFDN